MKITKSQLRQIILEEINALDEEKIRIALDAVKTLINDMKKDKVVKNLESELRDYRPARAAIRKLKSTAIRLERRLENLDEPSDEEVEDTEDVEDTPEVEDEETPIEESFVQRVKFAMMHKIFKDYTNDLLKVEEALDEIEGLDVEEFGELIETWKSTRDELKMKTKEDPSKSKERREKLAAFAKKGAESFLKGFRSI